jgi:putative PEP-CTERM system TPR-repeat lipoprotein
MIKLLIQFGYNPKRLLVSAKIVIQGVKMYFQLKLIPFALVLALAGCSKQTADELVLSAQQKTESGQISEGIIELKNAIQKAPDNAEARFLLGKMYVERGEVTAAEKELGQALKLGFEQNEVLPLLAKTYYLQFKNQEVIDLVDKSKVIDPIVETSLLLYKALAYFQINKPAKAKQVLSQASELSTESVYGQLSSAYLAFSESQLDDSLARTNELLDKQPNLSEAWLLRGQLATLNNNNQLAVESFEQYHKLLPYLITSKVFLATAYIKNMQFENAEKHIDQLLIVNKNVPYINQLKGYVRYQAKDFENAKLFTDVAIQNGLSNSANRIIAGLSNVQLKNYEQAYTHLSNVSEELPLDHPIRKILAIVALKLGYSFDASEDLINLEDLTENDMILLSSASSQLINAGKIKQARAILEKAELLDFTNPARLAEKGLMRLSLNDVGGIEDLQKALSLDPELDTANSALAQKFLERGFFKEALELANTWIKQKPDKVNGYILAGMAHSQMSNDNDAEIMYQKVLELAVGNPAANFYFADKAIVEGKLDKARSMLQQVVKINPNFIPALAKFLRFEIYVEKVDESLKAIQTAFENNQNTLNYRMLLSQAFYSLKNFSKTIDLLKDLDTVDGVPNEYWGLLTKAYFYNGEINKSIALYNRWIEQQPSNSNAYLGLIVVSEMNQDYTGALDATLRAKNVFTEDPQFILYASYFYIATNDFSKAETELESLPNDIKQSVIGQGLLGEILVGKGEPVKALPLMKSMFMETPTVRTRSFIAKALQDTNQNEEALSFLQDNEQLAGGKVLAGLQIAELAIASNDHSLAIDKYKAVLMIEPNNLRALNNLSYLLLEQKSFKVALQYAKAALDILPNNSAIMDTYGLALLRTNQSSEAVKFFEKALALEPTSGEISLHYAEALAVLNRKPEAKKILNRIKVTDSKFQSDIDRVKSML